MSDRYPPEEITVLIPGYTIEDLPSDLAEEQAESLLNAFAVAWHPLLLTLCSAIPRFRHSDSIRQFSGRHILLIPGPTEDWMPHDWHYDSESSIHTILRECTTREQWLTALQREFPAHETASAGFDEIVLVDEFLAFGTSYLLVMMLSRRMHHFVDPDEATLNREMRLAACAAVQGDRETAARQLQKCFELLRETREQFHPPDCFLLDLCIPASQQSAGELLSLLSDTPRINLLANAAEVAVWAAESSEFANTLNDQLSSSSVCLLTGHQTEVRSALNAPATVLEDMLAASTTLSSLLQHHPRHWARRRFGLLASMPMVLRHFGYHSACHFALDDGIYPDRERSQFDWQSPDGSTIAASSRIPVAVDSAAAILRLPDRFNESMQDDSTAVVFLARLPVLRTHWLKDLRLSAEYAPVLGEFVTFDTLVERSSTLRNRLRFEHGEYLSPYLIQSSVLKTESPVSGPAAMYGLWSAVEAAAMLHALNLMLGSDLHPDDTRQFRSIIADLLVQESRHADPIPGDDRPIEKQQCEAVRIQQQLDALTLREAERLKLRLPQQTSSLRGKLVFNTLPFARQCLVPWEADWQLPALQPAVVAVSSVTDGHQILLRLPPGGFVWLMEAETADRISLLTHPRRQPPLVEHLTLRNKHFEVCLSSKHGGIESVNFYASRGNRFSQQVTFRYEREQQIPAAEDRESRSTFYAVTRLVDSRIIESGPLLAELETLSEITSPTDNSVLAVCRQFTSIDRFRSQIRIRVIFEAVHAAVEGNPWMTFFGCRFAWDNENAAISRSVLGQTAGFRGERLESPDFIEVADDQQRFVVVTHGRPWHRRSGPRMLDSLLICEGEVQREFCFTVDFDQAVPGRTARDAMTPPVVLTTFGSAPTSAGSGWLLGLTARNVLLARIRAADKDEAAELPRRVRLTLMETEGVAVQCLVRTARQPRSASIVQCADSAVFESLQITDEGVIVPMAALQLREVELSFETVSPRHHGQTTPEPASEMDDQGPA